jgi:hypothetical protein
VHIASGPWYTSGTFSAAASAVVGLLILIATAVTLWFLVRSSPGKPRIYYRFTLQRLIPLPPAN